MLTSVSDNVKQDLLQAIAQEQNPNVRALGQNFYDTLLEYEGRKNVLYQRDENGLLPVVTQQDREFLIERYD